MRPAKIESVAIRPAAAADAPALSDLIQRSIRGLNANDYDAATIDLICANFTVAKVLEKMAKRDVFAALIGSDIIGTVSLGGDRLHSLFVDPELKRQGIGTVLVSHCEAHARSKNLDVLWLSSSLTARPFYRRLGYVEHGFEERVNGSTYLMSKALTGTGEARRES